MANEYVMTISRMTVDKLGVKLYDRISAVIAELVSNCYDADATEVIISAPMDEFLSTKSGTQLIDKHYTIEVKDNGIGMSPDEINKFYLVVGKERRTDQERGDISKKLGRKVMGRKGVGKLAPFGVCQKIEVLSSGGEKVNGKNKDGKPILGYKTAHFILDRSGILSDTDEPYYPLIGTLDGSISEEPGTIIRLSVFDYRKVPSITVFERQLSQRFGIKSSSWIIELRDVLKSPGTEEYSRFVGEFEVLKMEDTEIIFKESLTQTGTKEYLAVDQDGSVFSDLDAGIHHEGSFYPITGWVAYSRIPYKDDLMAGIRIYCRGKIAAQTNIFNLRAGFTGEFDIRSYLIGEIHADWLDEKVDLIRTDRQDILWSDELGQKFQEWGQKVVKKIGVLSREPKKKKAWEIFEELSNIHEKVLQAYPREDQREIRINSIGIAKLIAQKTNEEELHNEDCLKSIVDLSLLFGPHLTLDTKLREAADNQEIALSVITDILKTARVAELAGFGKIAEDRVKIIDRIEDLKDDPLTIESAFQNLITQAPWLINPQWAPVTANQSFNTFRKEFQKYYKGQTGDDINLEDFSESAKRTDFMMLNQDNRIEIIEIKKPHYKLQKEDMERIDRYIKLMNEFINAKGNEEFKSLFPHFHVTVVCDGIGLDGVYLSAFNNHVHDNILTHINWRTFLLRTKKMHEDFIQEAERQKKHEAKA